MSKSESSEKPAVKRLRGGWLAAGVFAMVVIGLGLFAASLNRTYYEDWAPFYDSVAYHNTIAGIMLETESNGLLAGLGAAIEGGTVCLPHIMAVFLTPIMEVSRDVGIVIQCVWVYALLVSLWFYFRICLKAGTWLAVLMSLPFASVAAIYSWNGGLPDFRMDLMLYLLLGCSVAWLFVALENRNWWAWSAFGVFVALCCLARATAPVYITLTAGPVILIWLIMTREKEWKRQLLGLGLAVLIVTVLAGWFFWVRFNELYYYYVIWNADANAALPVSESSQHIRFARDGVGTLMLQCLALGWFVLALPVSLTAVKEMVAGVRNSWWVVLSKTLPAVVPLAFLVFRGAGLNPYVCLPGAFGMVFLILSLKNDLSRVGIVRVTLFGMITLGGSLTIASGAREKMHPSPGMCAHMGAYLEIVDRMLESSENTGLDVTYGGITLGNLSGDGIMHVMIFDRGVQIVDSMLTKGDLKRRHIYHYKLAPAREVEWAEDWSQSHELNLNERMAFYADKANREVAFLIMPDDETAATLKVERTYNYCNLHAAEFRDLILETGEWKVIAGPIEVWEDETVFLYENQRLKEGE